MEFPIFKTKIEGISRSFDLSDPKQSQEYFEAKAGEEIEKLREYLKGNTFIAYLLGKKGSGKGTYSKMFAEIIGPERIDHFSIGDMVREVDEELRDKKKRNELSSFLKRNYRGWLPLKKAFSALEKRNTETLLPAELILALAKKEILRREKKTLFIDGFPRDLDQISYSLFFRDLIGYREDPDIFILIDVPENVIEQRIKYRVVCPVCQTSRNLKLFPTSKIGYDKEKKDFYLICDNQECKDARMVTKEGDELGIEPIRGRLELDEKLLEQAFSLYGIPKILLRNSIPVERAGDFVDDYEITPEYIYKRDEKNQEVKKNKKPWIVHDDKRLKSFSLLPQPVVISLVKQITDVLNL